MRLSTHIVHPLALAGLLAFCDSALSSVAPSMSPLASPSVSLQSSVQLDAARLLGMHSGETVSIDFPQLGRQTVVFEHTTPGVGGLAYWHGSVAGHPRDRVFLQQQQNGLFVGAIRMGGRMVSFRQQAGALVVNTKAVASVSGQVYTLGSAAGKGVYDIQGHLGAVLDAPVGSEITLPLPRGGTEVAIVTHSGLDADGHYQVQALSRLDGVAYPTLITVGPDAVFGAIVSSQGEFQIVTRQGRTQLLDPQGAGLKAAMGDDHVPVSQALMAAATATPTTPTTTTVAKAVTTAATAAPALPNPLPAGTVDTTITLLMTYSPSYVTQWGSDAVARARLSNLVQLANATYANSGTGIQFKVVGWKLVNQADTTPQTVLPAMQADKGAFAGVAALKKSTGAAIVTFYAPFTTVTGSTNTCGLAYVPAAGSQGLTAYKAQAPSLMFASLNDGQTTSAYCPMLSFPHELGHNLGALHDKANSSTTGVFPYSYGKGTAGVFGTVMSYISPRVALFSSPGLSCSATKLLCGSDTENVVATFLQTKSTVAALGNVNAASQLSTGSTIVAGFVRNSTGTAFTGAYTLTPSNKAVTCTTGNNGFYVCKVPTGTTSVTTTIAVTGKKTSPTSATFVVDPLSNTPVNGSTFYVLP